MQYTVSVANASHFPYAEAICKMMEDAAKVRGTGIAKRNAEYICQKMEEGKAVIALVKNEVIGFCYIESWEGHKYVANSGLIVHPDYRGIGLARTIKQATFELSKKQFPAAKLFGITTSMAVMKINSDLGYKPVPLSELTRDDEFWKGCQSCVNYDILQRTNRNMCLCTGMVCDLKEVPVASSPQIKKTAWENFKEFSQRRRTRVKRKAKLFPKLQKTFNNGEE
ncbi:MAG: GNAT family N-acetyltransferase [Chitinophagales bacterium]|nr:GNAT family N-acetyltransferase [Chitinophagales bacterium]